MELKEINKLTERIIGCAIEVHKNLGPGLVESIYETALCMEMSKAGLQFKKQVVMPVEYKGVKIGEQRIDVMVEDEVILELKSSEGIDPLFEAQTLSYLRVAKKRVGLIINFNTDVLKRGVKRMIVGR